MREGGIEEEREGRKDFFGISIYNRFQLRQVGKGREGGRE